MDVVGAVVVVGAIVAVAALQQTEELEGLLFTSVPKRQR